MPKITDSNYKTASLDEWQAGFRDLYGEKNAITPLYDLMLQMLADATRLAEAIRKRRPAEALPYIPRVFSWLCAMVNKCAIEPRPHNDLLETTSLSEITWSKYPGVCSLCGDCPCVCSFIPAAALDSRDPERLTVERRARISSARSQKERMPHSIDDWATMFSRIYGPAHSNLSLSDKTLHFFEEVGEIEVELRKADRLDKGLSAPPGREAEYAYIDFQNEVADVFSWLISIYLDILIELQRAHEFLETFSDRLHVTDGKPTKIAIPSFAEWLWAAFGSEGGLACHVCDQTRCACHPPVPRR